MTPDNEIARGHKATRLLNDDIFNEAFTVVRDRVISQLELVECDAAKRERLNNLLIALATTKKYIEQVAMSGRMAAEQIERDRTFAERVRDKVRSVA